VEDSLLPIGPAEGREIQEILAQYDGPAFVRRARGVEVALEDLLARARNQRAEWLDIVRLLLGDIHACAGTWEALRPCLDDDQLKALQQMHAEAAPKPRPTVGGAASVRSLLRKLRELNESVEFFNRRWQRYVSELDLSVINELREGYNRYFVLEKECALRSPVLARLGFKPLRPLTRAEVEAMLPGLPVLRLRQ
jgi:hypothetical protein